MQVRAAVECGRQSRKTDGTAEVAREIEQTRGVLYPLRRQCAEGDVVDGDHGQHQAAATETCGQNSSQKSQSRVRYVIQ